MRKRGNRADADLAFYTGSTSKNADDIVITLAIRTPLAKAKKGGFKDTSLEYMVYALLKEVKERSHLDPALIEDICLGNVCEPHHGHPYCITGALFRAAAD
jgi:acetyl-CoA acetyltransferase